MFRTNFDPIEKPVHEKISRHLARILQEAQSILYPQHRRGKHNLFADIPSRCYFLNTTELIILLRTKIAGQLPADFKIPPAAKRDKVLNYIQSVEIAKANAVTDGTHQDREQAWRRWLAWLEGVGLK